MISGEIKIEQISHKQYNLLIDYLEEQNHKLRNDLREPERAPFFELGMVDLIVTTVGGIKPIYDNVVVRFFNHRLNPNLREEEFIKSIGGLIKLVNVLDEGER